VYKVAIGTSRTVFAFITVMLLAKTVWAQDTNCPFNPASYSFEGNEVEQARCLMRPVLRGGNLGPQRELPAILEGLVGQRVAVSKDSLRRYLRAHDIKENDTAGKSEIGGSLDDPLSRANSNDRRAPFARYFVIHDTSTPNLVRDLPDFPHNINDADWEWRRTRWNNLSLPLYSNSGEAHMYINRVGQSVTPQKRTFATPWRATQFESNALHGTRLRGLFLHIENIQPRRCNPTVTTCCRTCVIRGKRQMCCNDAVAPEPGFSEAQLSRLALVYVAASVRRGTWLIPVFHCVLDTHPGIPRSKRHDDPQNFDVQAWADSLQRLLTELEK